MLLLRELDDERDETVYGLKVVLRVVGATVLPLYMTVRSLG